jgi:PPM family protein phosphatase
MLDIGQATDVGRVREANEDALLALPEPPTPDGPILVAVADGMGGHRAGEVASAIAIDSLRDAFNTATPSDTPDAFLARAVEAANAAIYREAARDEEKEGMGTTLVCAVVSDAGDVVIANVGDSRAYAVSDGRARLVTSDHTWVNERVLAGEMSERDARHSPYRNLLTRSLGGMPSVDVDVFVDLRLEVGDALVLCSDGVTGYLDERDVAGVVRACETAQEAAERLVHAAVERGGADNATAVVVLRR